MHKAITLQLGKDTTLVTAVANFSCVTQRPLLLMSVFILQNQVTNRNKLSLLNFVRVQFNINKKETELEL